MARKKANTMERIFKLYVEDEQVAQFKKLAEQEKVSVSWLMRKAFDEFLERRAKKK